MNIARTASLSILVASLLNFASGDCAESKSVKTDKKDGAVKKEEPAKKAVKNQLLSRQARIKFGKAERIAQKKVPGKTQEIELELEDGKVVYSVEIEAIDGTTEVSIDAKSGEILKVEKDDEGDTDKAEGEKGTKDGGASSD